MTNFKHQKRSGRKKKKRPKNRKVRTNSDYTVCKTTSKRGYRSKLTALGVASRAARVTGDPQRAYRCEHCDRWHLTHQDRRRGRA